MVQKDRARPGRVAEGDEEHNALAGRVRREELGDLVVEEDEARRPEAFGVRGQASTSARSRPRDWSGSKLTVDG